MKISKYDVAVVLSIMFLFASVALPLIHGNSLKFDPAPTQQDNPNNSPRRDMAINYSVTCNSDSSANIKIITTDALNGNYVTGGAVRLLLVDPYIGEVANNITNIIGETSVLLIKPGTYQIIAVQDAYRPSDTVKLQFSLCPVVLPPVVVPPKNNETIIVNVTIQNNTVNNTTNLPPVIVENNTEVIVPLQNVSTNETNTSVVIPPVKNTESPIIPTSNGLDSGLILLLLAGLGFVVLVGAIAYYVYSSKGSSGNSSSGSAYKSRSYQPMSEVATPKKSYRPRKKKESGAIPPSLGE
ncbi:MAG: hypothetical protein Q7S22_05605 [Candidatus Micrarchaeota archaeon]|nr:hypothetical protein [Candidatus Micrarchaeota archaeon]